MTFWHFRQRPGPSANARTGESSGGYGREMLMARGAQWQSVSVFDTTPLVDYTTRVRVSLITQDAKIVGKNADGNADKRDGVCTSGDGGGKYLSMDCVYLQYVCPSVCILYASACAVFFKQTCSGRLLML